MEASLRELTKKHAPELIYQLQELNKNLARLVDSVDRAAVNQAPMNWSCTLGGGVRSDTDQSDGPDPSHPLHPPTSAG